jgi:hypothetical protein
VPTGVFEVEGSRLADELSDEIRRREDGRNSALRETADQSKKDKAIPRNGGPQDHRRNWRSSSRILGNSPLSKKRHWGLIGLQASPASDCLLRSSLFPEPGHPKPDSSTEVLVNVDVGGSHFLYQVL